jgi:excinuclease ABC subunit C
VTTAADTRKTLSERLRSVPTSFGVYMWRDDEAKILYVGKASSLRSRMRSYVAKPASLAPKTRELMARTTDFEYIITESEQEALLLENSLIKRHQPRFNVRLRDDKTYPYIKIDLTEEFPQVYITRKTANDGARYFGPFASAGSVRKTLTLLKRLFPYRSCTKAITGVDDRPCLDYHIKRCIGPCIGVASRQDYSEVIDQVVMFLEGRTVDVVRNINGQMLEASDELNFERAAILRDQLKAVERVYEGQKVLSMSGESLDVIAASHGPDEAWMEIFFIRQGKLIGRDNFMMSNTRDTSSGQIITDFVKQFYDSAAHVPRTILLAETIEDVEFIESWLTEKRQGKVEFFIPQRGEKRRLVEMVRENAAHGLERMKAKWAADSEMMNDAMGELEQQLSLPRAPIRMECYDISHIQGTNTVASMAVFENGKPKSAHYRRFKIKSHDGNDDFASMREVLTRRFKRLKKVQEGPAESDDVDAPEQSGKDEESFGEVPDLVLIDGGKGQLSSAIQVFLELGIKDVPLASLAKREEEIFVPEDPDPIVLPRSSNAMFLVQRIRDEAHRFAITFHRQRRQKSSIQSALDLVPGIGPKRKRMLIRTFGSLKGVRDATTDEIASAPGMTRKLAEKLKEYV